MHRFLKSLCLILAVCFCLTSVFSVYADEDPPLSSDTTDGGYSSSEATVSEETFSSDSSTVSDPAYPSSSEAVSSYESLSSYTASDSSVSQNETDNSSYTKQFAPTEPIPSFEWTDEYETALNNACSYLALNQKSSEYLIVTGISGTSGDTTAATRILNEIEQKQGNYDSSLELARDILTLTFSSFNPEDFRGINLIQELANTTISENDIYRQAITLIAFDSGNFSVPDNAVNSRSAVISRILSCQTADGSFTDSDEKISDITATAMAITALSPYRQQTEVADALQKALSYLSQSAYPENCTESAWVITALSSLSLTPTDTRFTHGASDLVTALLNYQQADGGFSQTKIASDSTVSVTEISVIALTAAKQQTNPFILQNGISYDSQADSHKAFRITVTAVGCVLLLVAVGGCTYIFVRRKKQHNSKQE